MPATDRIAVALVRDEEVAQHPVGPLAAFRTRRSQLRRLTRPRPEQVLAHTIDRIPGGFKYTQRIRE